jgi:hypothetical protein
MIIGRVADAAAGENHITGGHRAFEGGGEAGAVVTHILNPTQA